MDGQTHKIGNSTITNANCAVYFYDCHLYQVSISPTTYYIYNDILTYVIYISLYIMIYEVYNIYHYVL